MKKTRMIACAVLVASLSMGAYGTFAYYTSESKVTNVITSGDVEIALKQTMIPEDGGDPVPLAETASVMPGKEISQIVQVENKGSQPAYVRVKLEKEIALAEGVTEEPDLNLVSFDLNEENWIADEDGYYYYKEPLAAGVTTEPLLTQIEFDKTMGNMYQNSKADILVSAQGTQVVNNGATVLEAKGWPADN